MRIRRALLVVVGAVVAVSSMSTPAVADTDAERTLAERYAPVVRLVAQPEKCGPGEPYAPSDVEVLLENPSVALRGPWTPQRDLIEVAPSGETLSAGLRDYLLDFPGDPLRPGCDYEAWADRQWKGVEPTVYAHVATESGVENRFALQYFFFYPFNDYNNTHEGDWERIQLEFDAPDAAAAVAAEMAPTRAVYSQHYGSEFAEWGSDKLELVEGRPVVYVSSGSHAAQFSPVVYLGNSAQTGFGCDVTVGPHTEIDPVVATIPSDVEEAEELFPWIAYDGHWGEVGSKPFYEGPTGPNRKSAWTKPFTWSDGARDSSLTVAGFGAASTDVIDFYCSAVSKASNAYREYVANSGPILGVLGVGLLVVVLLLRRTSWQSPALPLAQERSAAEVVTASVRMLRGRGWTFLALASPAVVANVVSGAVQSLGLGHSVPAWTGLGAHAVAIVSLFFSAGAITVAIEQVGEGSPLSVANAYREGSRRLLGGLPAVAVAALSLGFLSGSFVLAPLAFVVLGAWSLLVAVIVLERRRGLRPLVRSLGLVWRSLGTTLPVLLLILVLMTTVGTLVGALLFAVTTLPLLVLNVVPPLTLAVIWPLTCVLATYSYYSAAQAETPDVTREASSVPL